MAEFEPQLNPIYENVTSIEEVRGEVDQLMASEKEITVRGRVVALRDHKKTIFADIQDQTGMIQVMVNKELVTEDFIPQVGDLMSVGGVLKRSNRGELSVQLQKSTKYASPGSLGSIPADQLALRQVGEMIENPERFKLIKKISIFNSALKKQMDNRGFFEFQTPVLKRTHEAGTARPFETFHNSLSKPVFLRLTMESELRKLLASGFERVFEFGKSFRNEGMDKKHLPEFSLLEAYSAYTTLPEMLTLFSGVVHEALIETSDAVDVPNSDLFVNWEIVEYSQIEDEVMILVANDHSDRSTEQKIMSVIKKNIVPRIQSPTFLVHLPSNMSPFAKRVKENGNYSQRAWAIAGGLTFCDIYEDETDPKVILENLLWQDNNLSRGEHVSHKNNQLAVVSKIGVPPSSSFGLSMNRLHMIINNLDDVRDTEVFIGS